jgi:hypothetical protein
VVTWNELHSAHACHPPPAARRTLRFSPQRISPVAVVFALQFIIVFSYLSGRRGWWRWPVAVAVAVSHVYLSGAQPRRAEISKKGLMPFSLFIFLHNLAIDHACMELEPSRLEHRQITPSPYVAFEPKLKTSAMGYFSLSPPRCSFGNYPKSHAHSTKGSSLHCRPPPQVESACETSPRRLTLFCFHLGFILHSTKRSRPVLDRQMPKKRRNTRVLDC